MTDYSVDYFLAKFEAIPEQEWYEVVHEFHGEAFELLRLFIDNYVDISELQPTPKQRILAALRDIKAAQNG